VCLIERETARAKEREKEEGGRGKKRKFIGS